MKTNFNILTFFSLLLVFSSCAYNKKDLPAPEEVVVATGPPITYTNHTKRLFDSYCISCHAPTLSQANFPLTTYLEVTNSTYASPGGIIQKRVLDQGNMPPIGSATGQLTIAEKDTLQMWLNQGAPQ